MSGFRQKKNRHNYLETTMKGRLLWCGEYAVGLSGIKSLYSYNYISKTYSTKLRPFVSLKLSGLIVLAECLW